MDWTDVTGHDDVLKVLQHALTSDRVSHAYLFEGPDNVGKSLTAGLFAAGLNCLEPEKKPCGQCVSCRKAEHGNHPDIRWIVPDGASIGIDQIRELQRSGSFGVYEGRYRVVLIDSADAMTEQAQNSLLKSLEEPPPNSIFVLITSRRHMLRDTILSRCQVLRFKRLPLYVIEAVLVERRSLTQSKASTLASLADGRIGWALDADIDSVFDRRDKAAEWLKQVVSVSDHKLLALAEEIEKEEDRETMLGLMRTWLRDLLVCHEGGGPEMLINGDRFDDLQQSASRVSRGGLIEALSEIEQAQRRLQRNANVRLTLDVMTVKTRRGFE